MQQRHLNRFSYFTELANSSREFFLPYINEFTKIEKGVKVLEIGCGEGGNLLPFAELGCEVTGIELTPIRVEQANEYFERYGHQGTFIHGNFITMDITDMKGKFDIIIVHDVIEHIPQSGKQSFVDRASELLSSNGVVFWGFPAWRMPFGGHQQIAQSKFISHAPFIHLLPKSIYGFLLRSFKEGRGCVDELLDIKECQVSISRFEELIKHSNMKVIDRKFWFINPHYKEKFGLKPRVFKFPNIKGIRDFFCTSCFYMTK